MDEKAVSRLERKISDILNSYTSKIDRVASELASLREAVEALREEVSQLREGLGIRPRPRRRKHQKEEGEGRERQRKTAIDILREQGVIFESSVKKRLKNADQFFKSLKARGAEVIETDRERIAVDPEFFKKFEEVIARAEDEEDVRRELGERAAELFVKLREAGLIVKQSSSHKLVA